MANEEESLIPFPCDFPIKAMGRTDTNLEPTVVAIVRQHVSDLGEAATHSRLSKNGNYISVTVTIRATSRAQLDAIYQDLTDCKDVLAAF